MNKKIIIIIIIGILVAIIAIGIVAITSTNGEIVIDNVAGVDNVILPSENFSKNGEIPMNGFSIIHYKKINKDIHFYDLGMNNTGYTDLITNPEIDNHTVKTISGIKGDLIYYSEAQTLAFTFEVNNKMYSIDVMFIEESQVEDAKKGIEQLLTAWLKASGYIQTQTSSDNSSNETIENENTNKKESSWDSETGKGTPSYEDYKNSGAAKGDNDVSYDEYKDAMKNWNPNEEHIG